MAWISSCEHECTLAHRSKTQNVYCAYTAVILTRQRSRNSTVAHYLCIWQNAVLCSSVVAFEIKLFLFFWTCIRLKFFSQLFFYCTCTFSSIFSPQAAPFIIGNGLVKIYSLTNKAISLLFKLWGSLTFELYWPLVLHFHLKGYSVSPNPVPCR